MSAPAAAPHWLAQGVIYEIFPRAFSAAGTLAAITARLAELDELGVTTLWLMPLHPVGRERRKGPLGSPYAVRDYGAMDPALGNEADLRALTGAAHGLGLRVIIDWVANHSAWDNPLAAAHPEWYRRDPGGVIQPPTEAWTDVAALDHAVPALRQHLVRQMVRWVADCGVDGFRCDVAGLVPLVFWEEARQALQLARPDVGLLAEAYHPRLMEHAFDVTYDYPWYHALRDLLAGKGQARLWQERRRFLERFPARAAPMRFLDNHDQRRLASILPPAGCFAAATLLLCTEGVPLIYNGQELGDLAPSRAPALFHRHVLDRSRQVPGLCDHYRELIRRRRQSPALSHGTTLPLTEQHPGNLLAFLRVHHQERLLVAVHLDPQPARAALDHPALPHGPHQLALPGWGWQMGPVP